MFLLRQHGAHADRTLGTHIRPGTLAAATRSSGFKHGFETRLSFRRRVYRDLLVLALENRRVFIAGFWLS